MFALVSPKAEDFEIFVFKTKFKHNQQITMKKLRILEQRLSLLSQKMFIIEQEFDSLIDMHEFESMQISKK